MSDSSATCFDLIWTLLRVGRILCFQFIGRQKIDCTTFALVGSCFVQMNVSLYGFGMTTGFILNKSICLLNPVNLYVFPGCDVLKTCSSPLGWGLNLLPV